MNSGALAAADPGGDGRMPARQMQRRAFERRLLHGHAERLVHLRLEQRTQIMQAADRKRAGDTVVDGGLQPAVIAQHAGDEMAASGVAGEPDRPGDERSRLGDRRGDLGGDVGDACGRRQRVARQRHRPAMLARAFGQISPGRFVEAHPVAAVDEDDEALAVAVGQDQVEALTLAGAIGDVGAKILQPGAVGGRPLGPLSRHLVRAGDVGRVGVSIIPIAHCHSQRTRPANRAPVCHRSGQHPSLSFKLKASSRSSDDRLGTFPGRSAACNDALLNRGPAPLPQHGSRLGGAPLRAAPRPGHQTFTPSPPRTIPR
ncbi:hypothetical protein ABIF95_001448 [Bradyrhizobium ottawaense]